MLMPSTFYDTLEQDSVYMFVRDADGRSGTITCLYPKAINKHETVNDSAEVTCYRSICNYPFRLLANISFDERLSNDLNYFSIPFAVWKRSLNKDGFMLYSTFTSSNPQLLA